MFVDCWNPLRRTKKKSFTFNYVKTFENFSVCSNNTHKIVVVVEIVRGKIALNLMWSYSSYSLTVGPNNNDRWQPRASFTIFVHILCFGWRNLTRNIFPMIEPKFLNFLSFSTNLIYKMNKIKFETMNNNEFDLSILFYGNKKNIPNSQLGKPFLINWDCLLENLLSVYPMEQYMIII